MAGLFEDVEEEGAGVIAVEEGKAAVVAEVDEVGRDLRIGNV